MVWIKLKGELDFDLKKLGLMAGQTVFASPCKHSNMGVMNFEVSYNGFTQDCCVWPENYELVEEPTENRPVRTKIYPTQEELEKLGFVQKGEGDDPRGFWHEIDLGNDFTDENNITLELDAYFDFTLCLPDLTNPVPLNFQSVNEISIFIQIFKRPCNHAFLGLMDVVKSNK
ncbi:MAG TPA: hypothetical protein PLH91_00555 [Tenuifilaceae bacterium]|nr:hypothetical protein [Tenuifilaceae bacterium]